MAFYARRPSSYVLGLRQLPQFVSACWRCLFVFKHPWIVIGSYVRCVPPRERVIALRNGHVIHLSTDPADIVTLFRIFGREDYGRVAPGAVVVDVGANIGLFATFAAFCGAKAVHGYEPSAESYGCLADNIEANHLGGGRRGASGGDG